MEVRGPPRRSRSRAGSSPPPPESSFGAKRPRTTATLEACAAVPPLAKVGARHGSKRPARGSDTDGREGRSRECRTGSVGVFTTSHGGRIGPSSNMPHDVSLNNQTVPSLRPNARVQPHGLTTTERRSLHGIHSFVNAHGSSGLCCNCHQVLYSSTDVPPLSKTTIQIKMMSHVSETSQQLRTSKTWTFSPLTNNQICSSYY